jgi:hypothetical protein
MCRDCGLEHRTGLDALICDWELGGEPRVRGILARLGVTTDVTERTVAVVAAAGSAIPTEDNDD